MNTDGVLPRLVYALLEIETGTGRTASGAGTDMKGRGVTAAVEPLTDALDVVDLSTLGIRLVAIAAIVLSALLLNLGLRVGLQWLIRRAVRRSLAGRGRWTQRAPRAHDGAHGEKRRLQRADAAAFMLARLSSVALGAGAVVAIAAVFKVQPLVLVSSAGFVGAGVAVGGQTTIKDWLTGLLVLLEDRYAVGDQTTMHTAGNDVTGTVEMINGASVRLRLSDGTTWHAAHGAIESVINHSQKLVANDIQIPADVWNQLDETTIGSALNAASHDLGLTGIVMSADLQKQSSPSDGATITVHASRQLNEKQRQVVAERVTELDQAGSS